MFASGTQFLTQIFRGAFFPSIKRRAKLASQFWAVNLG